MVTKAKYKTAPLKCWQKGKELRLEAYRDLATGHEQGKLLVVHIAEIDSVNMHCAGGGFDQTCRHVE